MYMFILNKYWNCVLQKKKNKNQPSDELFISSVRVFRLMPESCLQPDDECVHIILRTRTKEGEQMEPNNESQGTRKDTTTSKYGTKLWEII